MNKPFLSIIIPLYNSEHIIEKTIQNIARFKSFLNGDAELLLIDDGSTDNTMQICQRYCNRYKNAFYFKKENGGIASARNFGIEHSRGNFLFFHDHDDCLDLVGAFNIVETIKDSSYDIYFCNVNKRKNGVIRPYIKNNANKTKKMNNNAISLSLMKTLCNCRQRNEIASIVGSIWACVIRKQFLLDNNLKFKTIINFEDDYLMILDILCNNPTICILNDCIYLWEIIDNSTSHLNKFDIATFDRIVFFERYVLSILGEENLTLFYNSIWGFYFDAIIKAVKYNALSYRCYLDLINKYDIRAKMISCKKRRMNAKKKILVFLFKVKMYKLIYNIIK